MEPVGMQGRSVSWEEDAPEVVEYQHQPHNQVESPKPILKRACDQSVETTIQFHPTFDSSDIEDGSNNIKGRVRRIGKTDVVMDDTFREVFEGARIRQRSDSEDTGETGDTMFTHFERNFNHALYISLFATFGAVIRIYTGRLFGLDCDLGDDSPKDFLTPFSEKICVTASGKTDQTGGALFTDLPSNMLGCFIIGVLSPAISTGHPIPWFRKEHPLQHHDGFLTALKVGLCGCLTTFASWNTQMIVMLDGTDTVLGPQVAPALFGYLIGCGCAVSSFIVGRHVHEWLKVWRSRGDPLRIEEEDSVHSVTSTMSRAADFVWERAVVFLGIKVAPFLVYIGLATAFGLADGLLGIPFYRKMWMTVIVSPLGALLRWRLSRWNNHKMWWTKFEWVPWGTLTANLLAAMISVLAEALEARYVTSGEDQSIWIASALNAVEAGFAGSLSTVSTVVKETFDLGVENPARSYLYVLTTILFSMLVGLLVYSPIVRS